EVSQAGHRLISQPPPKPPPEPAQPPRPCPPGSSRTTSTGTSSGVDAIISEQVPAHRPPLAGRGLRRRILGTVVRGSRVPDPHRHPQSWHRLRAELDDPCGH